ncbi:hypothetical protein B566_EDAN018176 [Ephemera danica]|nr:hypothetical protein B566_EDAN018176 [Ephemera danica]
MAALRLTLVLVLIFCSTKEHGQYSMAVLSAETTALRYRVYVLTLETGTQMDEIIALTAEAELLLTSHRKLCDDQKLFVDQAYTVGDAALVQLLATIP